MRAGNWNLRPGPESAVISQAIREVIHTADADVRVHVSRKRFDPSPRKRAFRLFKQFQLDDSPHQNSVLIYINPEKRHFVIVAGEGLTKRAGPTYLGDLAGMFKTDLQSTSFENAVGMAVRTLGATLSRHYPVSTEKQDPPARPN